MQPVPCEIRRDIIEGMTKTMHTMAYYLVIMFFIAQFLYAFSQSNLGVLLALQGAALLKGLGLPSALDGRRRNPADRCY